MPVRPPTSLTSAPLAAVAWLNAAIPAAVRFLLVAALPVAMFVLSHHREHAAFGYLFTVAIGLLLAGVAGALLALVESYVLLLASIAMTNGGAGVTVSRMALLTVTAIAVAWALLLLQRTWSAARADAARLRCALEALREKSDLLNRAQEVGAVGTWIWDAATDRSEWSEVTRRMYQLSDEDAATGDPELFWRIVHPDDRPALEIGAQNAFESATGYEVEHRIVRPDGEVRWLHTRGDVEHDGDGKPVRQLGVVIDVTERRRVEDELRRQTAGLEHAQEVLQRAQEIAKLGSFTADLRADRFEWSRELARLFDAGEEAFETDRAGYWSFIHPDERTEVVAQVTAALLRDDRLELEYRVVRGDGAVIQVQAHASIDRDAAGVARRVVGIVQDITEQRALEERSRQAQKLEAVGQLAGGVAHDFNNLLTVIAGNAELARDAGGPNGIQERLTQILRSSERGGDLVRQLLAFSRADVSEPQVVDLNHAVGEVRQMLARILEENIEVDAQLVPGPAPVLVDPGQLEQVLLNLAVNARDAMPEGGRLTIVTEAGNGTVTLCVTDTGIGMDAHTRERILDPFYTTKPLGQGTGLGLSTVYGIVSKAGGEIEVATAPGRGTTFTITFPRAPTNGELQAPSGPRPLVRGHGERVLIVEDEPMLLALTAELLSRAGYVTVTAENGVDALRAIEQQPAFDVIVSDLMMPKLTGRELSEELERRGHAPPIVYTSGYPQAVFAGTGLDDRSLLVTKPFTGAEITGAVRTLLDRTRPPSG